MTTQNIALVCDWLTDVGGAERVVQAVHEMYPEAPIYTSQYRPKTATWFADADVRTGWLNWLPVGFKRFIPFLRQWYFARLDLSSYDVVISITGAEAKGVKTGEHTLHISYMHAPTQYYWTLYDQYLENPGFRWLNPLARFALKLLVGPLRKSDYRAAQLPDVVVANSTYIQQEITQFYDRDSVVMWPNVDVTVIERIIKDKKLKDMKREGYIIYGRQVSWKRMDIAVEAATRLKRDLLVVGYGPENAQLRRLAADSKYVTFLPRYEGIDEIIEHVAKRRAFLFPSLEPFGIAPVEALAAGTPVIGLGKGGALDIIEEDVNGVLFDEQTVESLMDAMERFESKKFSEDAVRETAKKFSEETFKAQMAALVEEWRPRS